MTIFGVLICLNFIQIYGEYYLLHIPSGVKMPIGDDLKPINKRQSKPLKIPHASLRSNNRVIQKPKPLLDEYFLTAFKHPKKPARKQLVKRPRIVPDKNRTNQSRPYRFRWSQTSTGHNWDHHNVAALHHSESNSLETLQFYSYETIINGDSSMKELAAILQTGALRRADDYENEEE